MAISLGIYPIFRHTHMVSFDRQKVEALRRTTLRDSKLDLGMEGGRRRNVAMTSLLCFSAGFIPSGYVKIAIEHGYL